MNTAMVAFLRLGDITQTFGAVVMSELSLQDLVQIVAIPCMNFLSASPGPRVDLRAGFGFGFALTRWLLYTFLSRRSQGWIRLGRVAASRLATSPAQDGRPLGLGTRAAWVQTRHDIPRSQAPHQEAEMQGFWQSRASVDLPQSCGPRVMLLGARLLETMPLRRVAPSTISILPEEHFVVPCRKSDDWGIWVARFVS